MTTGVRLTQPLKSKAERLAAFNAFLQPLPPLAYPSYYEVKCIHLHEEANQRLSKLMKNEKVFGLDLEWLPKFEKNKPENKTALIQICSSRSILLLQASRMNSLPEQLKVLLTSREILKSGVDIATDGRKLLTDFGISANGLVDLRDMADMTKSPHLTRYGQRSLRALTGYFLNQRMTKGKIQTSRWDKEKLSQKQINYASLDAYASYKLFDTLDKLRDKSIPLPILHLGDDTLRR